MIEKDFYTGSIISLLRQELLRYHLNESMYELALQFYDVHKFASLVTKTPQLITQVLTSEEIVESGGRTNSMAGKLAAKIAIMQAVGKGLPFLEINIVKSPTSQPFVEVNHKPRDDIAVSISHDVGIVGAVALSVKRETSILPRVGIGIDIVSIARIDHALSKYRHTFLEKIYSQKELEAGSINTLCLAEKWAGKEAIAKALGTGFGFEGVSWREVSVLESVPGYKIELTGKAQRAAVRRDLNHFCLYIVRGKEIVTAYALCHQ